MTDAVLYSRYENVGVITLNRPERLNAINGDLLSGFIMKLKEARNDKDSTVIILRGTGKAFCSGEDLDETSTGKSYESWIEEIDGLQEIQRMIMRLGKPLIAAVQGYALGGGCEFAMSCDIRIVSEDVKFGFPETEVGLTVTTAGTKLLSQIVGLGKAKELIFTGEFVDAREALRIGLANKVVPTKEVFNEAMSMAGKIGEKSSLALKLSRTAIEQGLHSSFEQILEIEANHLMICVRAQEQKDFVEKKLRKMKKK